jgi:hypothetical protein
VNRGLIIFLRDSLSFLPPPLQKSKKACGTNIAIALTRISDKKGVSVKERNNIGFL